VHDKLRLLVAAEIDRAVNPEGQMSIGFVVVNFDNQLVASQLNTELPPVAAQSTRQHYVGTADVDPGKHSLKLVAVDDTGRKGSVELVSDSTLATAGPLRSSDLLLSDGAAGRVGAQPVPAVDGAITKGTLHAYLELYAESADPFERASVTLEIADAASSRVVERVPLQLEGAGDSARTRLAQGRVQVRQLPAGSYVAHAVIAIGLDEVGRVSRTFRMPEALGPDRRP
jgi:hypothetical protein